MKKFVREEAIVLNHNLDDLIKATRYWDLIRWIMDKLILFLIWSKRIWRILNGDARTERLINDALCNYEVIRCFRAISASIDSLKKVLKDLGEAGIKGSKVGKAMAVELREQNAIKYEKACLEWLKGCSCARKNFPEDCSACTKAFLGHIKKIGGND